MLYKCCCLCVSFVVFKSIGTSHVCGSLSQYYDDNNNNNDDNDNNIGIIMLLILMVIRQSYLLAEI